MEKETEKTSYKISESEAKMNDFLWGGSEKRQKGFRWIDRFSVFYLIQFYVFVCTIDFVSDVIDKGYINKFTLGFYGFASVPICAFSLIWLSARHYKKFATNYPRTHRFTEKHQALTVIILAGLLYGGHLAVRIIYQIYFK